MKRNNNWVRAAMLLLLTMLTTTTVWADDFNVVVGFNDGNTKITNCLFNGTFSTQMTGCRTFARSRDASKVTLTNVYYIKAMDDGTT